MSEQGPYHRWTRKREGGPTYCQKCGMSQEEAIHNNSPCPGEGEMEDEPKVMYTLKFPSGLYQADHPAVTTSHPLAAVRYRTPVDMAVHEHICVGDEIIRLVREDTPGEWKEVPEGEPPDDEAEWKWAMKYVDGQTGYWHPPTIQATELALMREWSYHAWNMGTERKNVWLAVLPVRLQRRTETRWRDDGEVR